MNRLLNSTICVVSFTTVERLDTENIDIEFVLLLSAVKNKSPFEISGAMKILCCMVLLHRYTVKNNILETIILSKVQ